MKLPFYLKKALVAIFCIMLATSCSTARKLIKIEKKPRCPTTVEGRFVSNVLWNSKAPAIIFRERGNYKIYPGEILALDSTGVMFDADRQSAIYNPEPKFYSFNELEAVIDSSGNAVFGEIPNKLHTIWHIEIHLQNLDFPERPVSIIETEPNQSFGYCITPSNYYVKEIRFVDNHTNIDISADTLDIQLAIEPSRVNYIGDIYLNSQPPENLPADSLIIPYKIHSRPEGSAKAGFWTGAIGIVLYSIELKERGIIGKHTLWVVNNQDHFNKAGEKEIFQNRLARHK